MINAIIRAKIKKLQNNKSKFKNFTVHLFPKQKERILSAAKTHIG